MRTILVTMVLAISGVSACSLYFTEDHKEGNHRPGAPDAGWPGDVDAGSDPDASPAGSDAGCGGGEADAATIPIDGGCCDNDAGAALPDAY